MGGTMQGGYRNCILRVNLTKGSFVQEPLSPQLVHDYIGGRGFGSRLLYDDLPPHTDPFGEKSELIFSAGPLAGTAAQSFGRWIVTFKSPLTGTYFRSSGGGHFAEEMKRSGLDAIIIEGSSDKPVYLWIKDRHCELRDAASVWGLDCDDTHLMIREELKDPSIRMTCIGPAGENKVKFAGIFSDRRTAGRGGGGAVMGAKNLKAIAIKGTSKVEIADPNEFKAAVKEQIGRYKASKVMEHFSAHGTHGVDFHNILGVCPTRNFREGVIPDWEKLSEPEYDKLRMRYTTCSNCMVHCGMIGKVSAGKYKGAWSEGPEYESMWSFSGPMATADIGLTIAADKLCDDLGLDTISTGGVIGFAYELYERGIINKRDTGGLELVYGNGDPVLELIRQIAYQEGFGAVLAEGTLEAGRKIGQGAEQYAMQVKGLEMPGYDPRGLKSHGLNLITSNCGANHNIGFAAQGVFSHQVDRFAVEGKAALTIWNQDIKAFLETGMFCAFPFDMGAMDDQLYGKLLAAATGVSDFADPKYLWLVGERIYNLERMFNIREGFSRKDDKFPERILTEVLPSGFSSGHKFEEQTLLNQYYQARGWDSQTGIPDDNKLAELGLAKKTANNKTS
jgi:aldehyde:ferredoxin oxidoreductase